MTFEPPHRPPRIITPGYNDSFEDLQIHTPTAIRSPTSPRPPQSPEPPITPTSADKPAFPSLGSFKSTDRARTESRKLLAHVLNQLQSRSLPPSVFEGFKQDANATSAKSLVVMVDAVRRMRVGRHGRAPSQPQATPRAAASPPTGDDEDEDEIDSVFSTESSLALMTQLRDVLMISAAHKWRIFDENLGSRDDHRSSGSRLPSPFRRSRTSISPSGRSRSPSSRPGSPGLGNAKAPELLSQCISVLSSIVLEDGRFKLNRYTPSRPPNTLQAVTLDIAQYLLYVTRHEPKTMCQVGMAMIPAFSTFPSEMHPRLLVFFDSLIRVVLEDLSLAQGLAEVLGSTEEQPDAQPLVSIQINEPKEEDSLEFWKPWSKQSQVPGLLSTMAPGQESTVYYLSALVSPLLAAIFECVDMEPRADGRNDIVYRVYYLFRHIVDSKPDAYLDILSVIAYHTPRARRTAVHAMLSLWGRAMGHLTISRPEPVPGAPDDANAFLLDHPYAHHFAPWRFSGRECHACHQAIDGFGVFCALCHCSVHFDCYDHPRGSHLCQYSLAGDAGRTKVAMYRFCDVLSGSNAVQPYAVQLRRHTFRYANLFTLCLCFVCRRPLWGCVAQGLRCVSCAQFAHADCILNGSREDILQCRKFRVDSTFIHIDIAELRASCLDFYGGILTMDDGALNLCGYEEVSVFYGHLWSQLQILDRGIGMGTIVVESNGKTVDRADPRLSFELHTMVGLCQSLLESGGLPVSESLSDFFQENHASMPSPALFFEWNSLIYVTTLLKSPIALSRSQPGVAPSGFLNVSPAMDIDDATQEEQHPYEAVRVAYMRDILGYELNTRYDTAARWLLEHMHQLGLFDRVDKKPRLTIEREEEKDVVCVFPLPLGLDISTSVETLVSAIEACLTDIDLSVNEAGFLLLLRRFPPDGMLSNYAQKRLTRSLVMWIIAEDAMYATILRDFVARRRALPGVRSGQDQPPWPVSRDARPYQNSSGNSAGDYVACRTSLLRQYAKPWLSALHDQDPALYCAYIYDICMDAAQEDSRSADAVVAPDEAKRKLVERHNTALYHIDKLSQASVLFDIADHLFVDWLDAVVAQQLFREPFHHLNKLLARDADSFRRSTINDSFELFREPMLLDPWDQIQSAATAAPDSFPRVLRWLCTLARSGVDVPIQTYIRFTEVAIAADVSMEDATVLVNAVYSSAWLRSTGRHEQQRVFGELHSHLSDHIVDCLKLGKDMEVMIKFIRQSLVTCLLYYGCDRTKLIDLGLAVAKEVEGLPSRRKMNARASSVNDPIIVDQKLMVALRTYLNIAVDDVSCMIAKFFHMFLFESPLLESYEVDNFILRNGDMLHTCAWELYEVRRDEISSIRTSLLLRVLVVDMQPLNAIIETWLASPQWERRLQAIVRLSRVIMDVTSQSFHVEDRQWRPAVIDVFEHFFTRMWADPQEEIRVAVDAFSSTLLPAHFEAISLCWSEAISKAPIGERVKLVAFLIQLHPHFPQWKLISWQAIVERLLEDEYDQSHNEEGPAAAHLSMYGLSREFSENSITAEDPEIIQLRLSILVLSIQMLASGISIDSKSLLRIKYYLAQVIGFPNVTFSFVENSLTSSFVRYGEHKSLPDNSHPCVTALPSLLDAAHYVDLPASAMTGRAGDDVNCSILVGSAFVDLALAVFDSAADLGKVPVLALKALLENVVIVFYKHDLESRALRHLQHAARRAVLRVLDLLLEDISYELRQLCLSVVQAFISRCYEFMGSVVYVAVERVVKVIIQHSHLSQDTLVSQCKAFLHTVLSTYATSGLFANLCKRPHDKDFFVIIKMVTDMPSKTLQPVSLAESLLRDLFGRGPETEPVVFQTLLGNMQSYLEIVTHQNFSKELMNYVGQQLAQMARRTGYIPPSDIDPEPLLTMPALLIQHNKAHSRDMFLQADLIVRTLMLRLNVKASALVRLLQVTGPFHRRAATAGMGKVATIATANGGNANGGKAGVANAPESTTPQTIILTSLLDVLGDGFKMKARVTPLTIKAILETLNTCEEQGLLPASMGLHTICIGLVEPGLIYLQNQTWTPSHSDEDLEAAVAVAKMILQVATHEAGVLNRLAELGGDKLARQSLALRTWNILVLAALLDPEERWLAMVYTQLNIFSATYQSLLRTYAYLDHPPETGTTDVNHAYIAIKFWLLLTHKKARRDGTGNEMEMGVWNELWPPFEAMVGLLGTEVQPSFMLTTLTCSTVADLVIFLRSLRSPALLQTTSHITMLNKMKELGREAATARIARAMRSLSEPPPDVSVDTLVSQAAKDVVAAEKLRVLESGKGVYERRGPERHRRDMTTSTR